jgi:hypothetical protein
MLKAVRAELVAQIGDRPTVSQRLLIDRVAQVSLQIHLMDQRKVQATRREYLDATRLLAELLAQLQPTASVSPIMPAASHCEAAA